MLQRQYLQCQRRILKRLLTATNATRFSACFKHDFLVSKFKFKFIYLPHTKERKININNDKQLTKEKLKDTENGEILGFPVTILD